MEKGKSWDVVIIHYNTPELTEAAIRSLHKHTRCHVIVFDNSDKFPFVSQMEDVEIIDNTRGQRIDFTKWLDSFHDKEPSPGNNYGSAKHCYSVEYILSIRKRPIVLMDGDVLIKKDITPLCDYESIFTGHIGCNTRRFGYVLNRVEPWLCSLNVPLMRKYGIHYFNGDKMWNLTTRVPNDHYDTGAWLLEEVVRLRLPYKDVKVGDYALHLRHGSWGKKDWKKWLSDNKALWE